jgi:hypothetical protein
LRNNKVPKIYKKHTILFFTFHIRAYNKYRTTSY